MIALLAVACLVVVLLALVGARRRAARAWAPSPRPERLVFPKVWFQLTLPGASMHAYRQRRTGTLVVDPDRGLGWFTDEDGDVTVLKDISGVEMGRRGRDFVNTWIEVHGDVTPSTTVAYLTDGRWLGWRPLVTSSNIDIANALAALMAAAS